MKDYYTILGLHRQASQDEIAAAYRELIANPAYRERMTEIREAYDLLSDPGGRDIYDQNLRVRESEPQQTATTELPRRPRPMARSAVEADAGAGRIWLFLVVAFVVIGGLLLNSHLNREQEKLRLEREREVAMRAQQAEEERQQREEESRIRAEEQKAQREIEEMERRNRQDSERALRDVERRSERESAQAQADARREAYQEAQKERDAKAELAREERERRERERHNRWILERPMLR